MPDKAKIMMMTTELDNFIRDHRDIYLVLERPETSIFPLLNILNATNIRGILTQNPYALNQVKLQIANRTYPLLSFENALPFFNSQTGFIVFTNKPVPIPTLLFKLNTEEKEVLVANFIITHEEALAIYDRITVTKTLKQYYDDGIAFDDTENVFVRFARGMSTFTDPRFQYFKIQYLDRNKSKIEPCEIDDTAIVIQGPLQYEESYTLTTAQLYREWYPNAPIIISTWKNEATEAFRTACNKISVVILENAIPYEPGALHVNYQIESSLKGVEYVKNNTSAKFVLKCRSDQRINRTKFLIYFKNLLEMYPPKSDKLKKRILTAGFYKWTPFFCCDFLYFGTVEDLNKLFNIPEQVKKDCDYWVHHQKLWGFFTNNQNNNKYSKVVDDKRKLRVFNVAFNKLNPPEIYILKTFYNKYIQPVVPEKLLYTYWKFIKDYLIFSEDIFLDWFKYNDNRQHISFFACFFGEWLDIYLHYKDDEE